MTSGSPMVSVILPTRDRAAMLALSAGSVLAQSYRDLELIVVDDGSTEDVAGAAAALEDDRVRYIRRSTCGGPGAARNTGLEAAQGRYVTFQDSDDEWLLDKLALQMRAIERSGDDTMCVCGLLRRLGDRWRPYVPPEGTKAGQSGFAVIASRPHSYPQTWLLPRAAIEAVGGFEERLRIWEDWELLLRLSGQIRIVSLPQPLVLSEQAPDSISYENKAGFLHAAQFILEKHAATFERHRRQRGHTRYLLARLLINAGQMSKARRALLGAISDDPARIRAWVLLAGSLLGQSFLLRRFQGAAERAAAAYR